MTLETQPESKEQIAHNTLCGFIQITIEKNNQNNLLRLTQELDCITSYKPESIRKWYCALTECVPFLQLTHHRNLWTAIFERFRWDFPRQTIDAYCKFCIALIAAHPVAMKPVLQSSIANFMDRYEEEKCPSTQS